MTQRGKRSAVQMSESGWDGRAGKPATRAGVRARARRLALTFARLTATGHCLCLLHVPWVSPDGRVVPCRIFEEMFLLANPHCWPALKSVIDEILQENKHRGNLVICLLKYN